MLPNPTRDRHSITVAKGVHHRSYARQVVATTCETVVPAMPAGWFLHHGDAVSVISVCPLLAEHTEFNNTAALVVVGHPTGNLVGGDSGNEHDGMEVETCFSKPILAGCWSAQLS